MGKILYASLFALVLLSSVLLVPSSAYATKDNENKTKVNVTNNHHQKHKKDPDKDKDNDKRACVHTVFQKNGKYKKNCDSDQDHKKLKRPNLPI